MGDNELDEDYLLTDDYPEINPSFYQEPTPSKPISTLPPTGAFLSGLPFSEGQTLPNFFNQNVMPRPQGPPVVIPPTVAMPGAVRNVFISSI